MVLSKDMKIAICFGLIMGAIISFCNLCFAAEQVDFNVAEGVSFNSTTQRIVESSTYDILYLEIEPGYTYTITTTSERYVAFMNSLEPGSSVYNGFYLSNDFTFKSSDFKYLYIGYVGQGAVGVISAYREPLQGMTGFVDNLAYDLSYANLSGVLFFVVPIMAIAILFALGFYLLKRLLNRIKRAKGGV